MESALGLLREPRWQLVVAIVAVLAAAMTVWVTARADFLAHPGWLAVQKADFVLGPSLIGLYWVRRRPHSRFAVILIGFGFVGALYTLQSASDPWLYSAGLVWENVVGLAAYVLILTFPTGRLDGRAPKAILAATVGLATIPAIVILLLLPQVNAGGSISGCRVQCPTNALAITSDPALALELWEIFRYAVIGVAVATAALLISRLWRGTPPQRRALAIGAPIALVFLALQVVFHVQALVAPEATELGQIVAWAFAGARAAIWYGFLAALIAAQLFAGRALQRLVQQTQQRPSRSQLEATLRAPLGDPRLRLAFWDENLHAWTDTDGTTRLERPAAASGLALTVIEDRGTPAAALIHDAQLDDDPELLQAAGAIALITAKNVELDTAWNSALRNLRESRARLVQAGDLERRKLERDLHDGVQQRLVALGIDVTLARERAKTDPELDERLEQIARELDDTLDELREVAHGLYPPILSDWGLVPALERVTRRSPTAITMRAGDIGRYPPEIESAVYHCCHEAIQNATKHAGPSARITVELREHDHELTFRVSDDGPGFDLAQPVSSSGLRNIRDRIGALDGHISIVTAPGQGTAVAGSVPIGDPPNAEREPGA
jgi:signal transduction histidine kinase